MDAVHDGTPPVFVYGTLVAIFASLRRSGGQLRLELSASHGIASGVSRGGFVWSEDRFVSDMKRWTVRIHPLQYARTPFRRTMRPQEGFAMAPQAAVQCKAGCPRQRFRMLPAERCAIPAIQLWLPPLFLRRGRVDPPIALRCATDRTWCALQTSGNCPQFEAPLKYGNAGRRIALVGISAER
jgi:hypothetical protein